MEEKYIAENIAEVIGINYTANRMFITFLASFNVATKI